MTTSNVSQLPVAGGEKRKLLTKFAEKFDVDETMLLNTLKSTVFKQRDGSAPSNEQMVMLMVVADQYQLNPFTKEIYAFPDQQNGIVPVVGIDGWSRIINNHPQYAGMEFIYSDDMVRMPGAKVDGHVWIECVMHRKDIERPIRVREYLDEVYREPFQKNGYTKNGPWQTHTKRFHRHKAMIQCSRLAFGFTGIYDNDEAERIVGGEIDVTPAGSHAHTHSPSLAHQSIAQRELTAQEKAGIDPLLQKAIQRSQELGNWAPAEAWVDASFPSAEHKAYALSLLKEAKAASQVPASQGEEGGIASDPSDATEQPEVVSQQHRQSPQDAEPPRPEDLFKPGDNADV